jgi:hypothetical protein
VGLAAVVSYARKPKDDGRPIVVVGDSYAVGVSAALRRQHPARTITSLAKGGVAAAAMAPAPEGDHYVIVSAGTNDAAGSAQPEKIAERIRAVLGPYGTCTATRGSLVYLAPHSRMGGLTGNRVELVRTELERLELLPSRYTGDLLRRPCRLASVDELGAAPLAADGIHLTPAGYEQVAAAALAAAVQAGAG